MDDLQPPHSSRAPARFEPQVNVVRDPPMVELDWWWIGGACLFMAVVWGGGIYVLGRINGWWA